MDGDRVIVTRVDKLCNCCLVVSQHYEAVDNCVAESSFGIVIGVYVLITLCM